MGIHPFSNVGAQGGSDGDRPGPSAAALSASAPATRPASTRPAGRRGAADVRERLVQDLARELARDVGAPLATHAPVGARQDPGAAARGSAIEDGPSVAPARPRVVSRWRATEPAHLAEALGPAPPRGAVGAEAAAAASAPPAPPRWHEDRRDRADPGPFGAVHRTSARGAMVAGAPATSTLQDGARAASNPLARIAPALAGDGARVGGAGPRPDVLERDGRPDERRPEAGAADPAAPGGWPAASSAALHRPVYRTVKRAIDLALTSGGVLALSPLLALVAALIKLEDGGPVLYHQTRVGAGGRWFAFYKFRSMSTDAEVQRAALKEAWAQGQEGTQAIRFKLADDPRVTRVGRWLRRFSLDELPQLFNVLRGDMSLVGPRPPLPEEVAEYDERAMGRLAVEQGITCLWQVSGRSLLPFERQVELDLEYVARRGVLLDLWLLARTLPAVLGGRGAY